MIENATRDLRNGGVVGSARGSPAERSPGMARLRGGRSGAEPSRGSTFRPTGRRRCYGCLDSVLRSEEDDEGDEEGNAHHDENGEQQIVEVLAASVDAGLQSVQVPGDVAEASCDG